MATIQMYYKNSSGYQLYYPQTDMNSVINLNSTIANLVTNSAFNSTIANYYTKIQTLQSSTAISFGQSSSAIPDDIFQILANAAIYSNGKFQSPIGTEISTPKIEVISYIGTGTTGENNPNSITLDYIADAIFYLFSTEKNFAGLGLGNQGNRVGVFAMYPNMLTTAYVSGIGFCRNAGDFSYGKVSSDKKTCYWYNGNDESQLNENGITYYFLALKAGG